VVSSYLTSETYCEKPDRAKATL